MSIKILPVGLVNKIAAGEVVERPASVVKELVENALDAGARRICVEIKDYGTELIAVLDDGCGMSEEDARLAIVAHATSKIQEEKDLFAIGTLGFRGEALASIAAVSTFVLVTKRAEDTAGLRIRVSGGMVESEDAVAADVGTRVEVHDLFFNTPARRKFLKSDAVELRHIIDVVEQYALVNSGVAFRLEHNGVIILQVPAVLDMRNTVASVYGVSVAKDLVPVRFEMQGVEVEGFVGKPYAARQDKSYQALFVNARWVRNADVVRAVYEGYHAALFVGRHPIFVLKLVVDVGEVDVNIHPQKSEVKFSRREVVLEAVRCAVQQALREHNLLPEVDVKFDEQLMLGAVESNYGVKNYSVKKKVGRELYPFETSTQEMLQVGESGCAGYGAVGRAGVDIGLVDVGLQEEAVQDDEVQEEKSGESTVGSKMVNVTSEGTSLLSRLPLLKILGQVHKTFFVAEMQGGVAYLDQHAVHERILYEKFMEELMLRKVEVQELLQGEILELLAGQKVIVEEYIELLTKMGFQVEHFEGNSYVLKTIPEVFGRVQSRELFFVVLEELKEERGSGVARVQEMIITRMACRAAVMAGEEVSVFRMEELVRQLGKVKNPYTCPHGRPTIITTVKEELEKKFRRKG